MKSVDIINDGAQYAIRYVIDHPDPKLISKIDTAIYKGQCKYYGIDPNIPDGFVMNTCLATDCTVTMLNIPEVVVHRIGSEVADVVGIMLNMNRYKYR